MLLWKFHKEQSVSTTKSSNNIYWWLLISICMNISTIEFRCHTHKNDTPIDSHKHDNIHYYQYCQYWHIMNKRYQIAHKSCLELLSLLINTNNWSKYQKLFTVVTVLERIRRITRNKLYDTSILFWDIEISTKSVKRTNKDLKK